MAVSIDRERVRQVAHLARLALTPAEEERFAGQLSQVLHHIETLSIVDVEDVPPFVFAGEAEPALAQAMLREDRVVPGVAREAALAAAPVRDERAFLVPRIIE
jgi:aspartyl-tRNA(Asn)/glutamyl-tRNA(Gln) amidotransferase subunit C